MRLAAFALLLAGCPCRGNPGVLVNARPDVTFVTEKATLIVAAPDGIRRVAIDGTSSTKLFAPLPHPDVPKVSVVDVTPDFKTYLLSDSHTNLFVGDATTGRTREIPALGKRLSSAAFSPDGTKIAATRHADYESSGSPNDDTVFVIDVATLRVETIPQASARWPTKIEWTADGSALWLTFAWGEGHQWLRLADRKRVDHPQSTAPPAPLHADPRRPPSKCPQELVTGRGPELSIVDAPGQPPRVLVRLEGRERGFHDYPADFDRAAMTPSCRFVVFQHRGKVWVTDLAGAAVGPLTTGEWLFFVP